MNHSEFNNVLESFLDFILSNLASTTGTIEITNAYVKGSNSSKYLYLRFICKEIKDDPSNIAKCLSIEMAISYDSFYQAPIVYFRVDDAANFTSKYTGVDIHPILHTPYNFIHACETESTMCPTKLSGLDYLSLWFAMQVTLIFPDLTLRGNR